MRKYIWMKYTIKLSETQTNTGWQVRKVWFWENMIDVIREYREERVEAMIDRGFDVGMDDFDIVEIHSV